jgi:hypothetical protein
MDAAGREEEEEFARPRRLRSSDEGCAGVCVVGIEEESEREEGGDGCDVNVTRR